MVSKMYVKSKDGAVGMLGVNSALTAANLNGLNTNASGLKNDAANIGNTGVSFNLSGPYGRQSPCYETVDEEQDELLISQNEFALRKKRLK